MASSYVADDLGVRASWRVLIKEALFVSFKFCSELISVSFVELAPRSEAARPQRPVPLNACVVAERGKHRMKIDVELDADRALSTHRPEGQ